MTDPAPEGARSLREIEDRAVEAADEAYWTGRRATRDAIRAALASLKRDGHVLVTPRTGKEQGGVFNSIVVRHGPQPFDTETEETKS